MATKIDICNLALVRLNLNPIQSLTQATKEARVLAAIYDSALDAALRAHPWNFATRAQALALTGEEHPRWTWVYAMPPDCVWAREIYNPRGRDKIEFEIARGARGRVVLTDEEQATLIYTERVTNPTEYDQLFVSALAYALAAEMAVAIKGNQPLQQQMTRFYQTVVDQARAADSAEGRRDPDDRCAYTEARK